MKVDLRKLRHAVALADERNFARAARRLHLTQSALSRSIQGLEHDLGERLFDRDNSGVALTGFGREVIKRAVQLLQNAKNLQRELDLLQAGEVGTLSFGAGPFPAATFLPPVLAECARTRPQLQLHVEINNWQNLTALLSDEKLSFFIADVRTIAASQNLTIRKCARQYGGIFCRTQHPLSQIKSLQRHDLLKFSFASVCLPTEVQEQLKDYLKLPLDADLPLLLQSDNPMLNAYVALHSDTVLLSTYAAVQPYLVSGELVALTLPDVALFYSDMGIVTLKGRTLSSAEEWLMARLEQQTILMAEQFQHTPPVN